MNSGAGEVKQRGDRQIALDQPEYAGDWSEFSPLPEKLPLFIFLHWCTPPPISNH